MAAFSVSPPYPIYKDNNGLPLNNGYIYIGTAGQNPETNPITVYWDAALTIPATQPIRTLGGYPSNRGSAGRLYVNADDYSITTYDKKKRLVTTNLNVLERLPFAIVSGQIDSSRINFTSAETGAVQRTLLSRLEDTIHVKDYGAAGDGTTDDTTAIQAAIDAAAGRGGRCYVDLGGDLYRTTDELYLKTDVVMRNGTISFDPSTSDKTAVNIAYQDGSLLVRVAGCENIVVTTSSTQTGTRGFNFGHLARACFLNSCRAIMNNGDPASVNRQHLGFSIYGIKADLVVSGAGAYQNTLFECSAYNCDTGYLLDTAGYGLTGYQPEMNGNVLAACKAYSCVTRALYVGEGAQDNHIQMRADTFVSQIGLGTTIRVGEVRGSYNHIQLDEEVGSRADTQYTLQFAGDNARYNVVDYLTQNVVTAAVNDVTTGTAVAKNYARFHVRPGKPSGKDLFTISGYESVGAGTNTVYNTCVLPGPCVLHAVEALNGVTPTSYTRLYFAKNNVQDTTNRVVWGSGDGALTLKELITDATAAGTIDSRFIYARGDRCDITIDQDGGAGQQVYYTLYFRMLHAD